VLPEVPRRCAFGRVRVRGDPPDRSQSHPVDVSDLGHRQEIAVCPCPRFERLPVDPPSSVGVPLDLHVLLELLAADGDTVGEESLHLAQDESVALERCGVVGLLEPDGGPDPVSPDWTGSPPSRSRSSAKAWSRLA